ncbi:MAG TPA: CoA-binding protein [Dehalococcoidia bacterium]|nr:CoA-binding protein [Dehalococcoidia bacterium]
MRTRREPDDTILEATRTIAVVGLSSNERRDSHRVTKYMQAQGYRIVPVNPKEGGPILGEVVYPSIAAIPASIGVDLVNVFRRSVETDEAIDAAIARGAQAVWLQEGITNEVGMERAREAGLATVQDRCLMVEHRRWLLGKASSPSGAR